MRNTRFWIFASGALVLAAAAPVACNAPGSGNGAAHGTGASGTGGSGSGGHGMGGGLVLNEGGMAPVVSITIPPADPVVEVLDGAIPAATLFTATGKTKGGAMVPGLTGSWSYDRPDVA